MSSTKHEEIRAVVSERYGSIARNQESGCGGANSSCCGSPKAGSFNIASMALGYSQDDVEGVPEGANLGLGCGNPQAIANLKPGETVLDLGSGGGFDCFLAARAVGPAGSVIGVDMTADMLSLARANAAKTKFTNVEFRLGEIEHLPVADASVDVIISNCVINLSPAKDKVFAEAFRVLKRGGRLAVSDMVASGVFPEAMRQDLSLYSSCVIGAVSVAELENLLRTAGFRDIRIQPKAESQKFVKDWSPEHKVEDYVLSATIEAVKA